MLECGDDEQSGLKTCIFLKVFSVTIQGEKEPKSVLKWDHFTNN